MSAITGEMRSDWRILRFINTLWAGVIWDYAPYPSPFHRHVNRRISISPVRGWEGSGWRPLLVTLGFHDGWGRWEGGQIQDAHELGMTSAVRSTLAVLAVSPRRISLINGHQGEGRLLFFWLGIQRSSWSSLAPFKPCLKHVSLLLAPWILHTHWLVKDPCKIKLSIYILGICMYVLGFCEMEDMLITHVKANLSYFNSQKLFSKYEGASTSSPNFCFLEDPQSTLPF